MKEFNGCSDAQFVLTRWFFFSRFADTLLIVLENEHENENKNENENEIENVSFTYITN